MHKDFSLTPSVQHQLDLALRHLYVNPLEKCNLKCKICYTKKTAPILSSAVILEFISRYRQETSLETITFCGGEVFALSTFPKLVNDCIDLGIFTQIITNGTIDRLNEFDNPNMIQLIVSLDGLPEYHDKNRGEGNFVKSTNFMKKAHELGFHLHVFSIVTHQNLPQIDAFEKKLMEVLGFTVEVTYHPRKPPTYLMHHPVSNIVGETENFEFLSPAEMMKVMQERKVFPPKELGCYQVAVMSDGRVFGCCEGVTPIGQMADPISSLITQMSARLQTWSAQNTLQNCLGCTQSEFMCGIKSYLQQLQGVTVV